MPKEKMLEILSKYGMDLNSCAPFFYEKDGQTGLVYQFSHAHYGILTRVFKVMNEKQLEEFAYQYWWFQKYAKTYDVTLELDDYKDLFAIPRFVRMNKSINSEEMKLLLTNSDLFLEEQKATQAFQRLLRTVNILIEIISLKKKMIRDTHQNAMELREKEIKTENEFIELYNRYQKDDKPMDFVKEEFVSDFEDFKRIDYFSKLSLIQQNEDFEELKKFVDSLCGLLKRIESNESYLKNKYQLIQIPLRLEDIRKKKNYMENLLSKKKGFFSKKVDPNIELKNIEEQSEIKKLTEEKDFILHEKDRLDDKYSIISEMDYETIGDYLNDFDNMGVFIPQEDDYGNNILNHQQFVERMKDIENNLSSHEIQCLSIYHSFLEPLCDIVLEQLLANVADESIISLILKEHHDEVVEAMLHLGDGENVFIRMQKMRLIDLSSSEAFLRSIILVCKTIRMMKKFYISGEITVFGQSMKEDINAQIYHANFKTVGSPIQKSTCNIHDIIRIQRHVPFIYFSKCYMFRDPFFHDYSLQEDQRDDILLILNDYQINWENSAIIEVSRFIIDQKNGKEVIKFSLEKIDEYRHISVSF